MLAFARPKCYLAGPMAGLPKHNYPLFIEATEYLRHRDYDIISPVECINNEGGSISWQDCMRRDLGQLVICNKIFLLPDWQQSRGATLELFISAMLGLSIYTIKVVEENGNRHFNLWQVHFSPLRALCYLLEAHFPDMARRIITAIRLEE
jgi:hypothetical protein